MDKTNEATPAISHGTLQSLQTRADTLLQEFRSYEALLREHKKQHQVEIRSFKRGFESEVKALEKLGRIFAYPQVTARETVHHNFHDEESLEMHALRSSNLPFYEAVWKVAKSCRNITAIGKKMYFDESTSTTQRNALESNRVSEASGPINPRQKGVIVDVVADGGLEWIKVSTVNEKRLLFEMAKEGWGKSGEAGRAPPAVGGSSGGHSDQKASRGPAADEKVADGHYRVEQENQS